VISVITPTWHRHDLLLTRCLPSVAAQTRLNVEHIVVSDGPDPELRDRWPGGARLVELAEHDPQARWGHWARMEGIAQSRGNVVAYLDDDNAWRPHHLKVLVEALETSGVDFAYGQMDIHAPDGTVTQTIGHDRPEYCHIDTSMIVHRRDLLDAATWRQSTPTIDWDLVQRWMAAGARWVHVPQVTVDYYQ
jgi:glycosyltransferase involved in cell wall biosynthesis